MKKHYQFPLVGLVIAILFATGCAMSQAPEKDQAGKTPIDYTDAYFEAVNKDDYAALRELYTKGYYASFAGSSAGQSEVAPGFKKWIDINSATGKTTAHIIDPKQCAFYKTSAPGVYSVSVSATRTEEAATLLMKKLNGTTPMYKADVELCFRLDNGIWRITDKTTGK